VSLPAASSASHARPFYTTLRQKLGRRSVLGDRHDRPSQMRIVKLRKSLDQFESLFVSCGEIRFSNGLQAQNPSNKKLS
jgi:hypothetical protein